MTNFQPIAVNRSGVTIPYGVGQYIVATVDFSDGTQMYPAGVYVDMPSGRQQLTMQGPKGDPGTPGAQGMQGIQGIQGVQGVPGERGPAGINGRSYEINGQVDAPEDLPAPSATYLGEAFFVGTTEPRFVYACVEYEGVIRWENQGTLQGPQGERGPQGIQGVQGPQGERGIQGPPGEQGPQGVPGQSFDQNGNYPNVMVGSALESQDSQYAGQLRTEQTIDGVSFNGTSSIVHYGVCSTAQGAAAKTVACAGFVLVTGARITVNFTTANTVSQPTLNVNNTGANAIRCKGRSNGLVWKAEIMTLVYDGTYWQIIDGYSLAARPVGKHETQYSGEQTPAALYGGTWTVDTDYTGRVLVGSGTNFTLGATGGEATHTLTVEEIPAHTHNIAAALNEGSAGAGSVRLASDSPPFGFYGDRISSTGGGQSHNNMQPYKVVAVWLRTA